MGGDVERLQELLKNDPSNFQARRELSVILADNGFNEEALVNLKYLEKYFPEDADISYNIGIINEKLKDYKSAEKAYRKAISISPQADFYYNLGEVLINLSKWDDAIDSFNEVLKTDSNDNNCYFNLGVCYFNKEEMKQAEDNFQKAININPQDLYAHFYLGNIYQEQGLTNFAEDCYKKVLEISPDYSWAYYNLASIAYQNGNIDEAKSNLLLTIDYNDTDIEAYKLLTKIFIKDNDIENILSILHTRLEKEENGDLFYVLAQVYKHIGKTEEYIENLSKALKNPLTLTYEHRIVKEELDKIKKSSGLNPPDEFDEYEEDENFEEDESDSDEYDEDEENEDEEDEDEDYDDSPEDNEYNEDENYDNDYDEDDDESES